MLHVNEWKGVWKEIVGETEKAAHPLVEADLAIEYPFEVVFALAMPRFKCRRTAATARRLCSGPLGAVR